MTHFRLALLLLSAFACTALSSSWMHAGEVAGEPTNAKEAAELAAAMSKLSPEVQAADAKRKAAMTPEELAWERVLESSLGNFYLGSYKTDKAAGKETAWDYVKDDPKLPRLLIIGDSISRGYTLATRRALKGRVNVHRAPENCGPTKNALNKLSSGTSTHLELWLGKERWDVIHVNFGIHDRVTDAATYKSNLVTLMKQLQATGAKVIWARTTPASPTATPGPKVFTAEQCTAVNTVADAVMQDCGIVTNDLYTLMAPLVKTMQRSGDAHFTDEGYNVMGKQVASSVLTALGQLAH